MKLPFLALFGVTLLAFGAADGQTPPPAAQPATAPRRMFVAPSSTTVDLGKVTLSVSPLGMKGMYYVGNYQIKVTPYAFKNEKGTLVLGNGDDIFGKLAAGMPVQFTGKATSGKDGKVKVVNGNATPGGNGKGSLNFSVVTDNGLMAFNTSYQIKP